MGAPSKQCFQLTQTFFGFDASYRVQLQDTIFDMIWFGEGRWDWDTIYNMPVFLRNHWINRINDIVKTKNDHVKQQNSLHKSKR
jgi:hypothetical protein